MKRIIRFLFQKFGYDIIKYKPPYIIGNLDKKNLEKEYKWVKEYQFKSIIDIGANEGQFSDRMRTLFPSATIFAFEPLPKVFQQLSNNFKNDPCFKAHNLALGQESGSLTLQESDYSPSSSFLNPTASLRENFEDAGIIQEITVQIETLDGIFDEVRLDGPLLIKIDVQGFEDQVIRGGSSTLKLADMIICELSFVELYQGQMLFEGIYQKFVEMGFRYAGSIDQVNSPDTNQILQSDGVFIR